MHPQVTPIQLTGGSVAIGGRPVLRGIDLTVVSGEFLALMGANGSGKTTLVRTITGLLPLTSGELRLFGTPFAEYDAWSRIGFVPQRASAASGVPTSVWEVVASGRLTRRRLLRPLSRADRAAIDHALDVVGLAERRNEGVTSLSGGQQQRVLIARALAGEPDLFVLDEPTAGVDLPSQQALAAALRGLKEAGATVVLVAHELGPLAPLVDRAVVMRDGRITYDGPPSGRPRGARPLLRRPTHSSPPRRASARPTRPHAAPRLPGGSPMISFWDLLTLDFMQRALLAAVFTGLAAPAVGTYLVQRRLSLMGDGIGHVAVTGVALGLVTGTSPTWTAVVVAALGAVAIELIRGRGHTNGDVALALMFYGGLAGGVLLTGLGGQSTSLLQTYLFGSITTISPTDVWVTIALAAVVIVVCVGLSPQLFAVAHDPEFARVAGVRVAAYNLAVAVLAAVSVTVAMRTVGLLLVSALMVVPVATAQQLSRSFRATLVAAMLLGIGASVGGLLLAAYASFSANVAPGPTIVLLSLAGFAAAWPLGVWLRSRQRLRAPFAPDEPSEHAVAHDEHDHVHGEDCGHLAVEHGDHVDYVHGAHRHAAHGEHYDEH